jgi:phosphoglycerate-specific signal transduction histidine kinase
MKAATVAQIRKELKYRSSDELEQLCLRLARFKKENKELLTYLLFESDDEAAYLEHIKDHISEMFDDINTSSYYYIKKSVRKILRETKKFIRYSSVKESEVELLLFFCKQLREMRPKIDSNRTLMNIFDRQVQLIKSKIKGLHEDLQYDYTNELNNIIQQS